MGDGPRAKYDFKKARKHDADNCSKLLDLKETISLNVFPQA